MSYVLSTHQVVQEHVHPASRNVLSNLNKDFFLFNDKSCFLYGHTAVLQEVQWQSLPELLLSINLLLRSETKQSHYLFYRLGWIGF